MTIPVCSWCGEYRAAPGSDKCALCRDHHNPPAPKPTVPFASTYRSETLEQQRRREAHRTARRHRR